MFKTMFGMSHIYIKYFWFFLVGKKINEARKEMISLSQQPGCDLSSVERDHKRQQKESKLKKMIDMCMSSIPPTKARKKRKKEKIINFMKKWR